MLTVSAWANATAWLTLNGDSLTAHMPGECLYDADGRAFEEAPVVTPTA